MGFAYLLPNGGTPLGFCTEHFNVPEVWGLSRQELLAQRAITSGLLRMGSAQG